MSKVYDIIVIVAGVIDHRALSPVSETLAQAPSEDDPESRRARVLA